MEKIIWVSGVRMYLLPSPHYCHLRLETDICIKIGTVRYWYRKAPDRTRKPKKRKPKQVAQPKKVIVLEGEKYYLTPEGEQGAVGDIIAKRGVKPSDALAHHIPVNGWRVYRRNETRVIDGAEYFEVRSGGYRPGDLLGNHPPLSVSLGLRHHVEAYKIWRPVPVKPAVLEWPSDWMLEHLLEGWNDEQSDEAGRQVLAILKWAKENQP